MAFSNAVRDARGNVIGFLCWRCRQIFDSMWGETCNACRDDERRHQELLKALRQPEGKSGE